MFAASTFEGRALTWWNGNVHTLGLVNANRDDIEAYNNRFHELALMCPELVPIERKKIEKYVRGFPERIKGNITSSKPATLHDAINMAREIGVEPIISASQLGKVYAGNLPKCNRCNFHHSGQCPPKCQKCQKAGHLEKDCRVRPPDAGVYPYQDVTCHGCGEKGHFRNRCPKAGNQQNVGARARAYAVGENPQQNPNVVVGSFDVIIGMDWLSCHRAIIDCCEKIIRIPLSNGKILESKVRGRKRILDHLRVSRLMKRSLMTFELSEISLKYFPNDLSGLPPVCELESPYRLAPSEMLELSNQLKELQEKGFIRPSHSPWGAPVLFLKKKDGAMRMCID
ncbi:putative reverse transcriptase domain-containing protein [Tanacetum coccineum]